MRGVDALINTYWIRFNHRLFTHEQAVANTKVLFNAAKRAGVGRIVHVSITKPDIQSDLSYFRGKGELENALVETGVSHCILRPTVLFGKEDILINNMAWVIRHFPVIGLFGKGDFQLQPIDVEDLADAAAEQALGRENGVIDAIGPETYTYRGLFEMIMEKIGVHRPILGLPPRLAYWGCKLFGMMVKDVIITWDEVRGLMENRLVVQSPPLGKRKLSEWVEKHKETIGMKYTSELARRIDRVSEYRSN